MSTAVSQLRTVGEQVELEAGITIVDCFPGYPAWSLAGSIAFLVPVVLTGLALELPALSWFYDYGWFTGSLLGGLLYYIVARESRSWR